jgi:hypothetical protein
MDNNTILDKVKKELLKNKVRLAMIQIQSSDEKSLSKKIVDKIKKIIPFPSKSEALKIFQKADDKDISEAYSLIPKFLKNDINNKESISLSEIKKKALLLMAIVVLSGGTLVGCNKQEAPTKEEIQKELPKPPSYYNPPETPSNENNQTEVVKEDKKYWEISEEDFDKVTEVKLYSNLKTINETLLKSRSSEHIFSGILVINNTKITIEKIEFFNENWLSKSRKDEIKTLVEKEINKDFIRASDFMDIEYASDVSYFAKKYDVTIDLLKFYLKFPDNKNRLVTYEGGKSATNLGFDSNTASYFNEYDGKDKGYSLNKIREILTQMYRDRNLL